jgi:trans-aconitate methyltransferase
MKSIWNPDLYDGKHDFVSEYGIEVLKLLNPQKDEVILDLGCGTGDLTGRIAELSREVVGVDSSPDMIKRAREKYPSVAFITGDARDFFIDRAFDAVFSNAVLHWVPEAEVTIRNINRHLKLGGRFVAEFGGKGCIQKIINELVTVLNEQGIGYPAINDVLYYPSISEYSALLERNGFEVTYALLFDRPTALRGGYEGLKISS